MKLLTEEGVDTAIDIVAEGKKVFEVEIETLNLIKNTLNGDFETLVRMINQINGRVIITGMGKSGHIGNKISATMSSLGTPTYFLHPAEGVHGDLGRITKDDIVIAISNSGETDEVLNLIPSIKLIGAKLVSITGKVNSSLEKNSDLSIVLPIIKEASSYNLAPTTSTTAQLVFGDAIAVVLSKLLGFKPENFAVFHPNGALGKRLLIKINDIMLKNEANAVISQDSNLKEAIIEMSSKGLSGINIVNAEQKLLGIITDGDLRRLIEKSNHSYDIFEVKVKEIMTTNPITINKDDLAIKALELMENRPKQIAILPVIDDQQTVVGMVRVHDILKAGIVL
ncbi:KpsF/GutQ family sugar-phosphate isomerase [Sutcliffiella horikoshii]|uniref:KpsF/GutQ family sugar-phosphate isomerase n=1 Tax=Sutcliffiella horikoshii TaxID=79883 RepID=UPI001CFF439D|nr:KpsF/GutQ family sugar-phosphate isomerase [Sutcliffiella horikoshii]